MSLLLDLAYLASAPFALPLLLRKRLRTGKYRSGIGERFGMGEEPFPPAGPATRTLLLHCVSVGELNSVQTLLSRLLAADADLRVVLTTGTDTGTERAQKLYGNHARVFPFRFPFDFSYAVERLLDRTRPDAIALVELETWPNFLAIAADRRIPVAIINGRISERSFPRYQLIRPLMAAMLRQVDWIGAQTETIAQRFISLGADKSCVDVIPTLKYDNAVIADAIPGQEALAAAMGLASESKLLVGGSIAPGEEAALLQAYQHAREVDASVRLALAPRHPEAVPGMLASIRQLGLTPVLRSEHPDAPAMLEGPGMLTPGQVLHAGDVFVLNTFGELRKLYALAFAVFVGRSLVRKGGGGSDMIEVAALGKACCFGPYTANFAEVVELLVGRQCAVEVADGADLTQTILHWLKNPGVAMEMGRAAQDLIRQQQAVSTTRYVEHLQRLMIRRPALG